MLILKYALQYLLVFVLQGGTIAILAALERPNYFNGIITSAPLVIPTNGFPSKFKVNTLLM